jgi:hypothetical protein
MNLRLLSAQPATNYYAWQVEVYIHNFLKLGYNGNFIDVVASYKEGVPASWRTLQQKFPYVRFFFYEDTRIDTEYSPAVQAHMLEKHFTQHPYLEQDAIFFHDCDFIFTKRFDFSPYLNDNNWYLSDTISYIGGDYIKSKGEAVLDKMCETVGIKREVVEANQKNSGGAQKLMKNVNADYWRQVYDNSINLYRELKKVSHVKKNDDPNGIQIWTASMWAELWTAWKLGHTVIVPKEFDFCWATCPIERWNDLSFFHNAGVPNNESGMFFKADYINKYPYLDNVDVSAKRCSYNYYNHLKTFKSCLI